MSIDPQRIINSPFTIRFVSAVAWAIPPALAYPFCSLIGDWVATRQSTVTQAIRINQWVARGTVADKGALDLAVRETLRNNIRDLYDLYHYLQRPEAMKRRILLNPLMSKLLERPEFSGRGLMIVGVHLSNFDGILQSLVRQSLNPLVLTIPNPQGGRRIEYEIRKRTGMNLVPASLSTLRQAVRHLEQGGLVLTGIDRPIPDPKLQPQFFGYPAPLPSHHVYLAMKARVPVVLMAAIRQADGKYRLMDSGLMEMEQHADHESGMLANAEMVLRKAEGFIKLAPQQWNIPLPVWPQLLKDLPG
jgi:KDO2-lipid IV(A) lauroyltransferase